MVQVVVEALGQSLGAGQWEGTLGIGGFLSQQSMQQSIRRKPPRRRTKEAQTKTKRKTFSWFILLFLRYSLKEG